MAIFTSVLLTVIINIMIISFLDFRHTRMKKRCKELRDYIKFLESSSYIEDAQDGAQWLDTRAEYRKECDIQDINHN